MDSTKRFFLRTSLYAGLYTSALTSFAFTKYSDYSVKLNAADENDIMLPNGFTSKIIAISGQPVLNLSGKNWHFAPDGGHVFKTLNGGWIYVSNSEVKNNGGVASIVFDNNGEIVDHRVICRNTNNNCAGGSTPWNTWLTCEEVPNGYIYECDPAGVKVHKKLPALGKFMHEAACIDSESNIIYMTEDDKSGGFYRFTPSNKSSTMPYIKGRLEVAHIKDYKVVWNKIPQPSAPHIEIKNGKEITIKPLMLRSPNRRTMYTPFNRGEGISIVDRKVYFSTTGDNRINQYDIEQNSLSVIYNGTGPLTDPDNISVGPSGSLVVAEDSGNMELVAVSKKMRKMFPILRVIGHNNSEITGPSFTEDFTRLYFSSQRGRDGEHGITYEVRGPFSSIL